MPRLTLFSASRSGPAFFDSSADAGAAGLPDPRPSPRSSTKRCISTHSTDQQANTLPHHLTEPNTTLSQLLAAALPLPPAQRARLVETTPALATAHADAAARGDSAAPSAQDDVDLHYVCFVKGDDGTLWELDGRRKGPLKRGELGKDEDVLSEKALVLGPRSFLEREGEDVRFSCVVLAGNME